MPLPDAQLPVSVVIVSKDEPSLDATIASIVSDEPQPAEIIVVDASDGRLDAVRVKHPEVRWITFEDGQRTRSTIPHQRNLGVSSSSQPVIAMTDCGCRPQVGWLRQLVAPLDDGESVTCGPARSDQPTVYSGQRWSGSTTATYVAAAPTINLAFRRRAYDAVGGFDERFAAGEDLDFTWRLVDAGYRLRWVAEAVVVPDWGGRRRQLRRAYRYGRAWTKLLRKHPHRVPSIVRSDPVVFAYPIYLLGLPLTIRWRWYPLLLIVALWRQRQEALPWLVVADHLALASGVLAELALPDP